MPIRDRELEEPLYRVRQRLSDEFDDIDLGSVRTEVDEVAEALLEEARFPNFVPLLTYRFTREHLLDEGHRPSREIASREN